jgi:hypothetical protein
MSIRRHSIIVLGGGIAGCAAAVQAARLGYDTLLIESYGFLGGTATAGLVNPFMSSTTSRGKALIGGIFTEIRQWLAASDGLLDASFDSEQMKLVLQNMVTDSGAKLRLHTSFVDARAYSGGDICVRTFSKSGFEEFHCDRLVDASGDADAAVALGAGYQMGDESGLCQAVTLMFDLGGVDLVRALTYVRDNPDQMRFPKLPPDANAQSLAEDVISVAGYYNLVAQARACGEYDAPGDLIFYIGRPRRGEVSFNTTHIGNVDPTNADDLTRAEIELRSQMASIASFVRKYVPGFENSYLLRSAPQVGVRETRRIVGDYVFSKSDVTEGRKFPDAICRLAYPVDIHSGRGEGYTREEERIRPQGPPDGDWYEIPYRCLLPSGVENVLVAGRCVSSTHEGQGAIRIMPAVCAMGQAAGAAAALSLKTGVAPRCVEPAMLRSVLVEHGAIL